MYVFITNMEERPMTITVLVSVTDRVGVAGIYSCFLALCILYSLHSQQASHSTHERKNYSKTLLI